MVGKTHGLKQTRHGVGGRRSAYLELAAKSQSVFTPCVGLVTS